MFRANLRRDGLAGLPAQASAGWMFKTGAAISSTPAIVEDVVYFGSFDGTFYALDLATGEELWRHRTGQPIFSSAAVYGDMAYVGCDDGTLYALSRPRSRR